MMVKWKEINKDYKKNNVEVEINNYSAYVNPFDAIENYVEKYKNSIDIDYSNENETLRIIISCDSTLHRIT